MTITFLIEHCVQKHLSYVLCTEIAKCPCTAIEGILNFYFSFNAL